MGGFVIYWNSPIFKFDAVVGGPFCLRVDRHVRVHPAKRVDVIVPSLPLCVGVLNPFWFPIGRRVVVVGIEKKREATSHAAFLCAELWH